MKPASPAERPLDDHLLLQQVDRLIAAHRERIEARMIELGRQSTAAAPAAKPSAAEVAKP